MAFQRAVFYKFKETATEDEIARHFESFRGLADKIDVIFSYNGGRSVLPPENPESDLEYDAFHYATFASEKDIETYYHHKAHLAFIAENQDIWANVLVINAKIE